MHLEIHKDRNIELARELSASATQSESSSSITDLSASYFHWVLMGLTITHPIYPWRCPHRGSLRKNSQIYKHYNAIVFLLFRLFRVLLNTQSPYHFSKCLSHIFKMDYHLLRALPIFMHWYVRYYSILIKGQILGARQTQTLIFAHPLSSFLTLSVLHNLPKSQLHHLEAGEYKYLLHKPAVIE